MLSLKPQEAVVLLMQLIIFKDVFVISSFFITLRLRERDEEGGETSVPKLAKLEKRSSPVSKCIESTASSVWNSEEQHQKENNIQLTKESNELGSDKTDTKITRSENPAPKKRKELDDLPENTETLEIVFESRDLDWKKQTANQDQESQGNIRKKRCLEAKGSRIEEVNAKQKENNETLVSYVLLRCLVSKFTNVFEGCSSFFKNEESCSYIAVLHLFKCLGFFCLCSLFFHSIVSL